jgi:hypothetical protein
MVKRYLDLLENIEFFITLYSDVSLVRKHFDQGLSGRPLETFGSPVETSKTLCKHYSFEKWGMYGFFYRQTYYFHKKSWCIGFVHGRLSLFILVGVTVVFR